VKSWAEFEWLTGAREAIARLTRAGLPVLFVTNQSAIGRGLTTQREVDDIHARMLTEIQEAGGEVMGIYVCPHRPEDRCDCRKPEPGLLLRAAREHGIDLLQSFTIGDAWTDIAAGRRAGTRTILLTTEASPAMYLASETGGAWPPDDFAPDLANAVDIVLRSSNPSALR